MNMLREMLETSIRRIVTDGDGQRGPSCSRSSAIVESATERLLAIALSPDLMTTPGNLSPAGTSPSGSVCLDLGPMPECANCALADSGLDFQIRMINHGAPPKI
jgi:hypothetical protein